MDFGSHYDFSWDHIIERNRSRKIGNNMQTCKKYLKNSMIEQNFDSLSHLRFVLLMNISTQSQKLQNNEPLEQQQSKLSLKIEMMRQSVAQLSVMSKAKSLQSVNRLQKEYYDTTEMVSQQQRRLILQIQSLERTLLQIQRERILKQACINNSQQGIHQMLKRGEGDSKDTSKRNHQRYNQFRDQIMCLKIKLAQLEIVCKERNQKFQRQSEIRLEVSSKQVQRLGTMQTNNFEKQFGELRSLKKLVEEEQRRKEKDKVRISNLVTNLSHSIKTAVRQEQKRQKQCFQQNYKALQELFVFLSEQYGLQA